MEGPDLTAPTHELLAQMQEVIRKQIRDIHSYLDQVAKGHPDQPEILEGVGVLAVMIFLISQELTRRRTTN